MPHAALHQALSSVTCDHLRVPPLLVLCCVYPAGHFTQVNATRISIQLVNAAFGGYEVGSYSPQDMGCGHGIGHACRLCDHLLS